VQNRTLFQFLTKSITYATLLPIFGISIFLLIVYFIMTNYILEENEKTLLKNARISLEYAVNRESSIIETKMRSIADSHKSIYSQIDHFYKNRDKYTVLDDGAVYKRDDFGLYFQTEDRGGADAMSFLFTTLHKDEIFDYLDHTQWFDMHLKNAVDAHASVVASWIIDSEAMIRYYPFIELHQYLSDLSNFFEWSFYYEADIRHNPEKRPLWSSIYLDPAGNGWMTSYIAPIYDASDKFRGVVGVDVPIKELANEVIVKDVPFDGDIFLTDSKGMVIAISDQLNILFELVELKKNDKNELKVVEILKPIEHNLLKHQNSEISAQFAPFFKDGLHRGEISLKDRDFLVENRDILGTDWKVFFIFDKKIVIEDSLKVQEASMKISKYVFSITVVVLLVVVMLLYLRAKRLSQELSQPIIKLSKSTENISDYQHNSFVNIVEVDTLLKNFETMVNEVMDNRENLELKIAQRTEELVASKEMTEQAHKNIRDSINYASLIQQAILPENRVLDRYFDDHFIFWRPRDTVGGDIYFVTELDKGEEIIIMIIDGAGHGVPGAFVTMLVKAIETQLIAHLNSGKMTPTPANILQYFNITLKLMLKQNRSSKSRTGFDGGVLYYNRATNVCKYAGAKTPLYIIRDDEMEVIASDKLHVGFPRTKIDQEYTNYDIEITKGTQLYIATDGISDQEGENGSRYGKTRLIELLKEISGLPMVKQRDRVINSYEEFRSNITQTDDITVFGIEF
jgi:serine phosphatase RsbU (regulator of sigma subunit)